MNATLKELPKLFKQLTEEILPNHGFSPVKEIKRFKFPCIPVPKAQAPDKLIMRDPKMVKETLRKIKREGLSKFKIVSDFDQTLTKSIHHNRNVEGSFSIVKNPGLMSTQMLQSFERDFQAYKDKISNPEVDKAKKIQNSNAWMADYLGKIIKQNLHTKDVEKILHEAFFVPRPKLDVFLEMSYKYNVPLYIISAGLSNIIVSMLDHYVNLNDYEDFYVYGNEMIFDDEGYLRDFSKPHVHSYLKNQIFQKNQIYRRNLLLLGDLLHDVNIAKNIVPKSMVSIGFLNYATGYSMRQAFLDYARKYDIVLITDDSLALPEMILRYVLDLETEQNLFQYLNDSQCTISEARDVISDIIHKKEENTPL